MFHDGSEKALLWEFGVGYKSEERRQEKESSHQLLETEGKQKADSARVLQSTKCLNKRNYVGTSDKCLGRRFFPVPKWVSAVKQKPSTEPPQTVCPSCPVLPQPIPRLFL